MLSDAGVLDEHKVIKVFNLRSLSLVNGSSELVSLIVKFAISASSCGGMTPARLKRDSVEDGETGGSVDSRGGGFI